VSKKKKEIKTSLSYKEVSQFVIQGSMGKTRYGR
jgi:hypothetical protein